MLLRMTWKYCWFVLISIIIDISRAQIDSAEVPSKVNIQRVTPIYTSDNKTGLNISWAQPDSGHAIKSYQVQYRTTTGRWMKKKVHSNSPQTSYQLKDLAVGTNYSIRVRAVYDNGVQGEWSMTLDATTFDLPNISSVMMSQTTSSLYLQWSSREADDFIVYYRKADSPLHVSSDTTESSSYNITGLDSNTAYKVIVSARNPLGSANISVVNSTLPAVPSKVVSPTVKFVFVFDNRRVVLMVSWTPPQSDLNITSYEVQSRPNNTAEWKTVTVTGQLTQRAHTLENLTVGTEYSVRVRAVSDAGEGEWSEISVATTSDLIQLEVDRGDELLCLDQDVTLRCKHFPALYTKWVYDTRANWKVNGDVLSPDRSKYFSRQPSISMTHLVISLKPILFEAEQTLNYSCFLRVMNNVTLESDEVTISPLMNPMMPSFMKVAPKLWSVDVEINHNRVCFNESEQCTLKYIYVWQAPSQERRVLTSSQTEVTLFNLTLGTPYTLNVTAVAMCDNGTLNQTSETASTNFTTASFNDLQSYVVASSPNASACYGSTFKIVCNHPDIRAVYDNEEVFIDSSVSWRRDGKILTIDDDTYTAVQYRRHAILLVNYTRSQFFQPGINNFSCFLRGRGGVHFESSNVSIEIPGFPHAIKIDKLDDVIHWDRVVKCVPGISPFTRFELLAELPRNNSLLTQDLLSLSAPSAIKSGSFVTTNYSASLTEVSKEISTSKSGYVYVTLHRTQPINKYLMLAATKYACFGHHYTLKCVTPLTEIAKCGVSQPTWFRDDVKIDEVGEKRNGYSFTFSKRESILRIKVNESNFNMSHTFHCEVVDTWCGSSSNVTVKPLRRPWEPRQLNATPTSRDITLTWKHNKACFGECTFNVSRQVNGTVPIEGFDAETTNQTNHTFKGLTPSTTYLLTVLAVCDNEYISNEAIDISTTISGTTSDITLNLGLIMGLLLHGLILIA